MAKKSQELTEAFAEEAPRTDPGEDVQQSHADSVKAKGADAAVGAVRPADSQIRGSFMPGGGAGEDAHTAFDPDTHAQFAATATKEEREQAIEDRKNLNQSVYEKEMQQAQDEARAAVAPPGVFVPNPAPTEAALAAAPPVEE
jgi:hypothetical protein